MRVLDLFAGYKGWSQPFIDRGHEVYTVDFDKKFDVDSHMDIRWMIPQDLPWNPDIILVSPPCEKFSVMRIGTNWNKDNTPKTEGAREAESLVRATLVLIEELNPQYWIMENPVGKLRKLPVMEGLERRTVTYCQYGRPNMKPTDLWGNFPPSLHLRPRCQNGDTCHVRAVRGSKTSIQGWEDPAAKAVIPYPLALDVCMAAEVDLKGYNE